MSIFAIVCGGHQIQYFVPARKAFKFRASVQVGSIVSAQRKQKRSSLERLAPESWGENPSWIVEYYRESMDYLRELDGGPQAMFSSSSISA